MIKYYGKQHVNDIIYSVYKVGRVDWSWMSSCKRELPREFYESDVLYHSRVVTHFVKQYLPDVYKWVADTGVRSFGTVINSMQTLEADLVLNLILTPEDETAFRLVFDVRAAN
jgi:hypothetical protein